MEGQEPFNELKRIEAEIDEAPEFDALRPIFNRLNALMQAYPGDFDIQFTGNELKQRIMARGRVLKEESASAPPAPPPLSPPLPAAEEPVLPIPQPRFVPAEDPAALEPPIQRRSFGHPAGLAAALLIVLAGCVFLLRYIVTARATRAVEVSVVTTPPGANIKAIETGGRAYACVSNCKLAVVPGTYHVSVSLDGYDPVMNSIRVAPGQKSAVRLALRPQPETVRLLSDLERGKVTLDDQAPVDLVEGQWVFDNVVPGVHTAKVIGPSGSTEFHFEIAPARMPAITAVEAKDMTAVLVASFANRARVTTNAGPWKLTVNGQPQSDASPAGTDLTGFQPGVDDFVIREGQDMRNMSESFGVAPTLTAFLKTDVNAGTLIVSTGHDDVRVFLNGKEYRRRTQRGELRIQTLGKTVVRVAKAGFQDEPPQTVEVKKGSEVRVQFALVPQPQFGSVHIRGGLAGSEVLLDQKNAGSVGADGTFTLDSVPPGDHTLELRRERYMPKRISLSIKAGQTVVLGSTEAALAPAHATITLTRNPPAAMVTYRRPDETETHELSGAEIELPPGNYILTATAPGFQGATAPVDLAPGENRKLDVVLVRERPKAPAPVVGGMDGFEDPQSWKRAGDAWIHKGGGFVGYAAIPNGTFTFTASLKGRGGQVRWCVQYLDSKNYLLYELNRKTFYAGVVEKGKRLERIKQAANLGNQESVDIQVEIYPDHAIQKVRIGDDWKVLDTFAEPDRAFTKGKFGFLLPGSDEIAISDFKFVGR